MTDYESSKKQDTINSLLAKEQRTVMMIEDSEADRETYRRYLETDAEYHYTFIEAETGEEALDIYQRCQPDIILLDYFLPDTNGLQWLVQWQQLNNKDSLCPVIVLTGQGNENIAVQSIKSGAVDYFVKDKITADKLKLSVKKEIALKNLHREKEDFVNIVQSQSEEIEEINKLLQSQVNQCRISEQLVKNSEAKFRSTFEQAAVGIAHVSPDGKWLMVNQKLCQIVGYSQAELLQTTFQDITYPEDLNSDLIYVNQMLAGEIATYSLEKRYIRLDKSLVWINLTVSLVKNPNGEPEYFISVIEDISDRKTLEMSRKKALQRLSNLHQIDKAILEAKEPTAIAEIAINNIQQWLNCQRISILTFDFPKNSARIVLTKGEGEKSLRQGFEMSLDIWQDLIAKLQNKEQNYLVTNLSQIPHLSSMFLSSNISKLDCLICFPLRAKNKLFGILKLWVEDLSVVTTEELTVVSEISNQIAIAIYQAYLSQEIANHASELEIKVKERTTQLEEINKELKAFSYTISHDLKAPLRAIQGFATALQEDYGDKLDDLGREYTIRLADSAQQMEQLIRDLLAYSSLSRAQIKRQRIDLSSVIAKAIEQLKSDIDRTQAQITIDKPILDMYGNQTVVLQIVYNLLSNAMKFVDSGVQPQIYIATENRGNYVRLRIEDNGIGIEPQHQERIFRVFERLHGHESYPGTGIGLAIVRKAIERLEGRFGIDSTIGQGSCFWIELPC